MIKKALILAAGFGSRLKDYTKNLPKALVKVNKKPILFYQLEALLKNNIIEVGIVVGYKKEKIYDYLENYYYNRDKFKFSFFENNEYSKSNSSYSFWVAKDFIKDCDYIHLNCDIIFSDKLLTELINFKEKNVFAARSNLNLGDNMELLELDGLRVLKMDNKYYKEAEAKAFGVAKLSKESNEFVINELKYYLSVGDKNQNYYGILRKAVKKMDYYAIDFKDNLLLEINTIEDFLQAERILKTNEI